MNTTDKTNERGIGFQAVGFAVVGCVSVAILQFGSESDSWAYQSFQTAATRLYWAFVVPLAALFDWGRKMFETRKAIREAAIEKAIEKGVRKAVGKAVEQAVEQAVENERRRVWEQLRGLLPEEAAARISQVGPGSGVNAP